MKFTAVLPVVLSALVFTPKGGNDCSGTVYEGFLSSTLKCKSNSCATQCAKKQESDYKWCACGSETEPTCCHLILKDVFGPDIAQAAGTCEDCGLPGDCVRWTTVGPGMNTHVAVCMTVMNPW